MRLVVLGTDTGVGKTHVGCALVRALRGRGVDVAVSKPVESGADTGDGILRPADAIALAEAAGLFFVLDAQASPGFTVNNSLKSDVDVYIFYGDEAYCGAHEKHQRIRAGKTRTYGCSGDGEGKCKIALFVDGKEICQSDHNACSKSMIVMKDRSSVSVRPGNRKDKFLCQFR